jgi:transcriptional regulator with XRE-family HTH domain
MEAKLERARIGARIKEIRQALGISTYKLEEMTGIKRQNIERIEAGKYSTGIDILSVIAEALGCTFDILKKEDGQAT